MNLENLYINSDGLVVLSGTVYDLFGKLFKLNKLDLLKIIKKFKRKFFKIIFILEIQRHLENDEKIFEDFLILISSDLMLIYLLLLKKFLY